MRLFLALREKALLIVAYFRGDTMLNRLNASYSRLSVGVYYHNIKVDPLCWQTIINFIFERWKQRIWNVFSSLTSTSLDSTIYISFEKWFVKIMILLEQHQTKYRVPCTFFLVPTASKIFLIEICFIFISSTSNKKGPNVTVEKSLI